MVLAIVGQIHFCDICYSRSALWYCTLAFWGMNAQTVASVASHLQCSLGCKSPISVHAMALVDIVVVAAELYRKRHV